MSMNLVSFSDESFSLIYAEWGRLFEWRVRSALLSLSLSSLCLMVSSGYRQGNQYAQQDNYYSSNGYQSQAPAYPQQAYTPSRNGGYSNGGYTNTNGGDNNGNGAYGNGYNARNEYEMNNYSNGAAQQGENPLSAFFAEVRESTRYTLTSDSVQK
jgi:hypothetical protein